MAASRPATSSPNPKAHPPPMLAPKPRRKHPGNSINEEQEEQEKLEPAMEDTDHMKFVDGRCSCCPYGYHIDLDFLHYLDMHGDVSYLRNLKKIHHNKKKLRKSMEVFLLQQDQAMDDPNALSGPPPDVVHSTENFMNMVESEDSATNKILEEIDSSVNATIDGLMLNEGHHHRYHRKHFQHDDSPDGMSDDQRYRTEAELSLSEPRYGKSFDYDSCSSLDSTLSSEYSTNANHKRMTTTTRTVTSAQLADNMASLLPAENGSSSTMTTISQASLQAIREQMAMSLQRMRELEEQCKTIPVMQVRISVLKEEKHLLGLQLKAKSKKMNTRTIGVGDYRIEEPVPDFYDPEGHVASRYKSYTSNMWISLSHQDQKKPFLRTIGTGDGNVWDNHQLQTMNGEVSGPSKMHEREVLSEQSTHVHEKEVKTVFLGQSENSELAIPVRKVPPPVPKKPAKPTRSIGVGDSDVFDPKSNMHVHEKEMRTVFIGSELDDKPATRNVGVLCRPVMRDVGVTYMYENEMPNTRNIAVGVNEMGVGEGYGETIIGEDVLTGSSSSSVTTVHNTMQSMNLAAFHTKHIHIKEEMLRQVIDEKLKKDVRSVGVSTRMPTRDVGINHTGVFSSSVERGCGSDSVDVEVRPITQKRTVGTDHRPQVMNRLINTDTPIVMDMATNTSSQMIHVNRATNTRPVVSYPASTNTTPLQTHVATTETDVKVFQALDQVKNAAVNTQILHTREEAVNTDLHKDALKVQVKTLNKLTNTEKQAQDTFDRGVNTQPGKQYDIGVNTEPKRTRERGNCTDKVFTRNISANTERIRTINVGVGDSTIDQETVETTSTAQARHKVDCDICLVKPKQTSVQHATTLTSPVASESKSVATSDVVQSVRSYSVQRPVETSTKKTVDVVRSVQGLGSVQITPRAIGIGEAPVLKNYGESTESEDSEVTETIEETVTRERQVESALDNLEAISGMDGATDTDSMEYSDSSSSSTRTTRYGGTDYTVHTTAGSPGYSVQRKVRTESRRQMSDMLGDRDREEGEGSGADHSSGHLLSTDSGGTQMRVIRHVETTYVGGRPVKESSNVVMRDQPEEGEQVEVVDDGLTRTTKRIQKGGDGSSVTTETVTETVVSKHGTMQDSGITIDEAEREAASSAQRDEQMEYVESMEPRGRGRRVVVTETRIERRAPLGENGEANGTLKSIMKQPGTNANASLKKELSFCDDVVGGYVSRSSESESGSDDDEEDEEEEEEEGSEGSQSSISYEEGSYDGTLGKIEYTCKDDEAIAQGAPGAKMFDQNIRETFELSGDMQSSCDIYAQWLEDSTMVTTKQLNSSLNIIQQEWFKASGNKLSNPSMVEDYLNSFNETSHDLLKNVVNMADANGNTALHYAVSHCNTEIMNLLLDTQQVDVNKQNKAGYTAIMLASLAQIQTDRQRDVIHRLFEMADLNARASQAGQTALMLAVSHGRTDMVTMLLEAAADVNTQDEDGSTALMCASEHGHTDIVKMLLAHPDCDATLSDNDGSTAMSIAMEAGHRDIGVLLYAHVNFKPGSPDAKRKLASYTI